MSEGSARVESCIRGYHAYKSLWNPEIGDRLELKLMSSMNMIDMLWELSKMNPLLDTLHVKYRNVGLQVKMCQKN